MLFGETLTTNFQKGCVFEGRIVQKRAGSRMDVLFLGLIDYPCRVEAVSFYKHQSRRRGVHDGKDYFDVSCALHGWITGPRLFDLLTSD